MNQRHNGSFNTVTSRISGSSHSAATLTCFADCVCCRLTSARRPLFTQMASCAALISAHLTPGQSSCRAQDAPPPLPPDFYRPLESREMTQFHISQDSRSGSIARFLLRHDRSDATACVCSERKSVAVWLTFLIG